MGAFLQGNELIIILIILLLILGPSKLPALARGLGQAVREFRKATQGAYDESPPQAQPAPPAAQPAAAPAAPAQDEAPGARRGGRER